MFMSYLEQLQKTGTMNAIERQTRQFSDVQRAQTTTRPEANPQIQDQINQIQTNLTEQKNKFDRFLTINQNRIVTLEKEVNQLRDELNKKTELLSKISDRETVQRNRDALFNRKDRAPLDRPVDRNNVAPSQVQIENIFNCSGKKF